MPELIFIPAFTIAHSEAAVQADTSDSVQVGLLEEAPTCRSGLGLGTCGEQTTAAVELTEWQREMVMTACRVIAGAVGGDFSIGICKAGELRNWSLSWGPTGTWAHGEFGPEPVEVEVVEDEELATELPAFEYHEGSGQVEDGFMMDVELFAEDPDTGSYAMQGARVEDVDGLIDLFNGFVAGLGVPLPAGKRIGLIPDFWV